MKRCSQCGFTFEENEQICDFDGTELTTVPEPIPFYQKTSPSISTLSAVRPSLFRRFAASPVFLAVLAVAGLMASALLIGYYDSRNQSNIQLASNADNRNGMVVLPQGSPAASDQVKPEQVAKPRSVSTQRRIASAKSSSMPSSILRWESASSHSSRRRSGPSTSKVDARLASGVRVGASKQRSEKTNRRLLARVRRRGDVSGALARKHKKESTKANRESQAKNHTRPQSHERNLQRPGAGEVADLRRGRESESSRLHKQPNSVATSRARESLGLRHQKESKFVAILKKTGSILTKPFRF